MKKLIYAAVSTILLVSLVSNDVKASEIDNAKITHIVDSAALPLDGFVQGATHRIDLHVKGQPLSELMINMPSGVKVNQGIEVTNKSGDKISTTVSIIGRKASIAFSQPITPGTTLSISMRGVDTPGPGIRHYQVSAKKVGLNSELPLGLARINTYP
jgi:Protein of unknown function (DUF2808)